MTEGDPLVAVPVTGEAKFGSNGLAVLAPLIPKAIMMQVVLLPKLTVTFWWETTAEEMAYQASTRSLVPLRAPLECQDKCAPVFVTLVDPVVLCIEMIT